ncbi:MAG TPA: hypothetical protein VMW43_09400, partial [Bacteroidota bacterium]|nr:hypothetical protein [Bacteroidota bacterium]
VMIFDEASEALHGTFYGCLFHTGYFQPLIQREGKWLEIDHQTPLAELLLGHIVLLQNSVMQAANLKYENKDALIHSRANIVKIKDLLSATSSSVSINESTDLWGFLLPRET